MKNLIYLLTLVMTFNSYSQSTLGQSYKIKGKTTSNDKYVGKLCQMTGILIQTIYNDRNKTK